MQAEESRQKYPLGGLFTFCIDASVISLAQLVNVVAVELKQVIKLEANQEKA